MAHLGNIDIVIYKGQSGMYVFFTPWTHTSTGCYFGNTRESTDRYLLSPTRDSATCPSMHNVGDNGLGHMAAMACCRGTILGILSSFTATYVGPSPPMAIAGHCRLCNLSFDIALGTVGYEPCPRMANASRNGLFKLLITIQYSL